MKTSSETIKTRLLKAMSSTVRRISGMMILSRILAHSAASRLSPAASAEHSAMIADARAIGLVR